MTPLLFIIPGIAFALVMKFILHKTITWIEVGAQIAFTVLVTVWVFEAGVSFQTKDTMFVNGVITKLSPEKESCPSGWVSYPDNFCTNYRTRTVKVGESCSTSNKVTTCTPIYDTEYNYDYPWERRYFLDSTIKRYEVKRVDRQGVDTPPRFSEVEVGDPVTDQIGYTNYIKGAADSLFAEKLPEDVLPPLAYPSIRDIYKANRVIVAGYKTGIEFVQEWNEKLAVVNASLVDTGANAIVVITGYDRTFAENLSQAWDAHNLNDVIVVIGASGSNIEWVDVRSWSANSITNVKIRDAILGIGELDPDKINLAIGEIVSESYKAKTMEEFEYLADDIDPPLAVYIIAFFLLIVGTPAISYTLHRVDFERK